MVKKRSTLNEQGIAHLGLIILLVAVLSVGVFAFMRVQSANDNEGTASTQSTSAPTEEEQMAQSSAELEKAEEEVEQSPQEPSESENQEEVGDVVQ